MIIDTLQPSELILLSTNFIFILWLTIVTVLFISLKKHYNQLSNKVHKKNLQDILEDILKYQKHQKENVEQLQTHLHSLEKDCSFHLQYVGFLRFNPFADTGGGQSFAMALLDKHKNGVVFSSLHSLDNTRIYAKQILKGKCREFTLSEEELQAIASAQIINS